MSKSVASPCSLARSDPDRFRTRTNSFPHGRVSPSAQLSQPLWFRRNRRLLRFRKSPDELVSCKIAIHYPNSFPCRHRILSLSMHPVHPSSTRVSQSSSTPPPQTSVLGSAQSPDTPLASCWHRVAGAVHTLVKEVHATPVRQYHFRDTPLGIHRQFEFDQVDTGPHLQIR